MRSRALHRGSWSAEIVGDVIRALTTTSMHLETETPLPGTRATQNTAPYIGDAMAAHKFTTGEATRYDRLPDHDIDGDSDPTEHPASGTDADAPHSATALASRSVVRRRRQEPRPSPVKAMSLVGLKNLFFKQTVTAVPKRPQPSREYGRNRIFL